QLSSRHLTRPKMQRCRSFALRAQDESLNTREGCLAARACRAKAPRSRIASSAPGSFTRCYYCVTMKTQCPRVVPLSLLCSVFILSSGVLSQPSTPSHAAILHAARLLDIESGKTITPAEILVKGERIAEVGTTVTHPAGVEVIDLGDRTL